ncbi:MAG TPA: hypothetical protein VKF38_05500 [Anaerolineaceae bacterium]|nr:hypothetical protein [Anaerolineaceae bacterium]
MQSLLGDRFLKRFAGDLRLRRKHSTSNKEDQKPDIDEHMVIRSDSHEADGSQESDQRDKDEDGFSSDPA